MVLAELGPLNGVRYPAPGQHDDVQCLESESWGQRDLRLRNAAIVLTDSPVRGGEDANTGENPHDAALQAKLEALNVAYVAGALSRAMHAKAVEELTLANVTHDGVMLESNDTGEGDRAVNEDDEDCCWAIALESNEEA